MYKAMTLDMKIAFQPSPIKSSDRHETPSESVHTSVI